MKNISKKMISMGITLPPISTITNLLSACLGYEVGDINKVLIEDLFTPIMGKI